MSMSATVRCDSIHAKEVHDCPLRAESDTTEADSLDCVLAEQAMLMGTQMCMRIYLVSFL